MRFDNNDLRNRAYKAETAAALHKVRWDENAAFCDPRKRQGILQKNYPGAKQNQQIYDPVGLESAIAMSSGMSSALCPSNNLWFRFVAQVPEQQELLQTYTDAVYKELQKGNFYLELQNVFTDLSVFGTSCLWIGEREFESHFSTFPIGTYWIEENSFGEVDKIYRNYLWTKKDIKEQLGDDVPLPPEIASDTVDTKFKVLQAVFPNPKPEVGLTVASKRPWLSRWIYQDITLKEDGFYERPFQCVRLYKANEECWGRSPADQSMPSIMWLNAVNKGHLTFTAKQLNPNWLVPDTFSYKLDTSPGAINQYPSAFGPQSIGRQDTTGQFGIQVDLWQTHYRAVQSAFYIDVFQMFSNDNERLRTKTATEINAMQQEKLNRFAPLFQRLNYELFNPTLNRVLQNYLRRNGLEPVQTTLDYTSTVALSLRSSTTQAMLGAIQVLQQAAQFDPSILVRIDFDKALVGILNNFGVPMEWRRTDSEVQEILEEQAAEQQVQQEMQMALQGSEVAKNAAPALNQMTPPAAQ